MAPTLAYPTARQRTFIYAGFVGLSLTATALAVGTGGQPTADYYRQRGVKGYALAAYDPITDTQPLAVRTPAEDLTHVRATFKPSVTELANALGVSRQAVYDWHQGKPVAPSNAARLADLARAADVLASEGLSTTGNVLRRPIIAGKSLFDIVRDGGSAEEAARKLLQIVQREQRQRERLTIRLAGRRQPVGPLEDYGPPMLDEIG
jgi:transcriptional regulator with XRE-family HTH domain